MWPPTNLPSSPQVPASLSVYNICIPSLASLSPFRRLRTGHDVVGRVCIIHALFREKGGERRDDDLQTPSDYALLVGACQACWRPLSAWPLRTLLKFARWTASEWANYGKLTSAGRRRLMGEGFSSFLLRSCPSLVLPPSFSLPSPVLSLVVIHSLHHSLFLTTLGFPVRLSVGEGGREGRGGGELQFPCFPL